MSSSKRNIISASVQRQGGAALLVLMTGLLAVTGYVAVELNSANRYRQLQQQEITRSLAFAKNALIAYAVTYVDNYGHNTRGGVGRLPCPSRGRYGSPARSCGQNAIGYLPGVWNRNGKRIDIDHLEKFLDQDLWYGLSADFRYNPAFNVLNSDATENLLSVDGDEEVVALVIAPGPPLANQTRGSATASIADYLEGENADGDRKYSTSHAGNDRIVTITRSELMPLIERRVLGYARDWLQEYKSEFGYYPFAAPFGDPTGSCQEGLIRGVLPMQQGNCTGAPFGEWVSSFVPKGRALNQIWFGKYNWPDFIYYQLDENCTSSAAPDICDFYDDPPPSLSVNGVPTQVLLVSVGKAIPTELVPDGQLRLPEARQNSADLINYFDTPKLLTANLDYQLHNLNSVALSGSLSNDQYLVIQQ